MFVSSNIISRNLYTGLSSQFAAEIEGHGFVLFLTVCLRVVQMESTKVIFGSRLAVEVGYSLQEQSVLCVTNYPSFPLDMLKKALGHYFEKACYAVAQCEVIEDVAYVKFVDSSGKDLANT